MFFIQPEYIYIYMGERFCPPLCLRSLFNVFSFGDFLPSAARSFNRGESLSLTLVRLILKSYFQLLLSNDFF